MSNVKAAHAQKLVVIHLGNVHDAWMLESLNKVSSLNLNFVLTHKFFVIHYAIIIHLNFDIGKSRKINLKPRPTKKPKIGKQCSGKYSECPWDNCNSSRCHKGCASSGCTKAWCDADPTKKENQLCLLKDGDCEKGLRCVKQNDGCNNGIGRCSKIFPLWYQPKPNVSS